MKKIMTHDEKERIRKRNSRLIAGFMLLLMLGSTAGYAFFSYTGNSNSDNGDGGQTADGRYAAQYNGQQLIFLNSPDSIRNVSVIMLRNIVDYAGKEVYVDAVAPFDNEIGSTLGLYTQRIQRACYGACKEDFPEKNCSDNLIVYRKADTNRVYENSSCVFIEGDMKAVDAFLLRTFKLV